MAIRIHGLRKGHWRIVALLLAAVTTASYESDAAEISRFSAEEAHQGVAVNAQFVYAISNRQIGKYEKTTGRRVATWKESESGPIQHLNGGVVVGDRLYCGHSDYPNPSPTNTIEVWDTATLRHLERRVLPRTAGYCNWIDRHEGSWWILFADYDSSTDERGVGTSRTSLVRYDDQWRAHDSLRLPAPVVEKLAPKSCSGGAFGDDGLLYCTGHDARELYVIRLLGDATDKPPRDRTCATLRTILHTTLPMKARGQGVAWDRSQTRVLYGIDRGTREVIAMQIEEVE